MSKYDIPLHYYQKKKGPKMDPLPHNSPQEFYF